MSDLINVFVVFCCGILVRTNKSAIVQEKHCSRAAVEMANDGVVGLVYDARMCAHQNESNSEHPEQPERISSIYQCLKSAGIVARCVKVEAREATDEELRSVHTESHVELMKAVSSRTYGRHGRKGIAKRYNSIYFNEGSSESALLAAGSVIEVSDQVAQGKLKAGAAIVRPPGHHAEADAAMGFCLFNNVAIAAHLLVHKKVLLGSKGTKINLSRNKEALVKMC
jgi:histone deacetylase 4/5